MDLLITKKISHFLVWKTQVLDIIWKKQITGHKRDETDNNGEYKKEDLKEEYVKIEASEMFGKFFLIIQLYFFATKLLKTFCTCSCSFYV